MKNSNCQGFTIIEILTSILILGILTAVITSTMTGSLVINRDAQQQIDGTVKLQRAVETLRNTWQSNNLMYSAACYQGDAFRDINISYINLDSRGNELAGANNTGAIDDNCTVAKGIDGNSAPNSVPQMRKIVAEYAPNNSKGKPLRIELSVLK